MSTRFVSYYTAGTLYEKVMWNYLGPCLETFDLPYHIFGINDLGSWKHNVLLQPSVILTAMKTFPNDNIVWMDSDTMIYHHPELFNRIPERCDIGVYYLNHTDHYGPQIKTKAELLTGVIYFKNSPKMIEFVDEWLNRSAREDANHRFELAKLIDEKIVGDLNIFLLPRTYAYLATKEDGSLPAVELPDPIIVQHQASMQGKIDLYGDLR